jgi:hypothetical protein
MPAATKARSAILWAVTLLATVPPAAPSAVTPSGAPARRVTLSRQTLADKVKGGWAGQTIGCTYGGPTEFRYQGTIIPDSERLAWSEASIPTAFETTPGLYDDVYMDLTFVGVFEKEGLDAPASSFARAFAQAPYPLWHANQMARYNILRGLMPPASGDWRNNPHADDIDFQIEADFAGLMSPGLPNAATEICDRVGHIMNSGDGWYGGVYVAAMYALAFVSSDVADVAEEALKAIPAGTAFARAMTAVIQGHRDDPRDWKATWFRLRRGFGQDVGCPEGVFSPFDIDAKMNCAWVLLGLLYGEGDFGRTIDIAARCGDDSDCNPATAAGILGTMLGYERIPEAWKRGLAGIETKPFPYTPLSLRDAGRLSVRQALENLRRHGGRVTDGDVEIPVETPRPVRTEVAFPGYVPVERRRLRTDLRTELSFSFDGIGFAVNGEALSEDGQGHVLKVEMTIDGGAPVVWDLPTDGHDRNPTPFWKYELNPGRHEVRLKRLDPGQKGRLALEDVVIYSR